MEELDLSRLIGGSGFIVPIRLANKGFSKATSSLSDTGAKGYLFINTSRAVELAKLFDVAPIRLGTAVRTKGFDGQSGAPITHVIFLDLHIDGRQFSNQPFLIVNLGQHDAIIGEKWLAEKDVWLDVRHRRLV